MDLFGSEAILEWSLQGDHRRTSAKMIDLILKVAKKGGGPVPLEPFLKILKFQAEAIRRITSQREPIRIKSPKGPRGKLEGVFANSGTPLEAPIPRLDMVTATMKMERLLKGRFRVQTGQVTLTHIEGMTIVKELLERGNDEAVNMPYKVERLILKPQSLAVY